MLFSFALCPYKYYSTNYGQYAKSQYYQHSYGDGPVGTGAKPRRDVIYMSCSREGEKERERERGGGREGNEDRSDPVRTS